jgi:thioredoxin-like negative regulator of GroEL
MISTIASSRLFVFLSLILLLTPLALSSDNSITLLTDANFETTLAFPPALWLVKFYAPWCKHCNKLDPVFDDLAEAAGGRVMLGSVDATKNPKTAELHNIKGYPTILYKKDNIYGKYDGPRSLDGFLTFIDKVSGPSVTEIKGS